MISSLLVYVVSHSGTHQRVCCLGTLVVSGATLKENIVIARCGSYYYVEVVKEYWFPER